MGFWSFRGQLLSPIPTLGHENKGTVIPEHGDDWPHKCLLVLGLYGTRSLPKDFGHRNSDVDDRVPPWISSSSFPMLHMSVASTRFSNRFVLRTWLKILAMECFISAHTEYNRWPPSQSIFLLWQPQDIRWGMLLFTLLQARSSLQMGNDMQIKAIGTVLKRIYHTVMFSK